MKRGGKQVGVSAALQYGRWSMSPVDPHQPPTLPNSVAKTDYCKEPTQWELLPEPRNGQLCQAATPGVERTHCSKIGTDFRSQDVLTPLYVQDAVLAEAHAGTLMSRFDLSTYRENSP